MLYFSRGESTFKVSHYKGGVTGYRVEFGEGTIEFPGVVFAGKLSLIEGNGEGVVLYKVTGGTGWRGRGTKTYYSPHYNIGIVKKTAPESEVLYFREFYRIDYTKEFTKVAKEKAMELYQALLRGEEPEVE